LREAIAIRSKIEDYPDKKVILRSRRTPLEITNRDEFFHDFKGKISRHII